MAKSRTRVFATVLYPESASEDWKEYLSMLHVQIYVSPLHDQDVNPDGELKKPHYHILFIFDGVKSEEQIQEVIDHIKSVGREIVQSTRGYARYLIHADNPEKFQYSKNDVISFGGGDYEDLISRNADRYNAIRDMLHFCRVHRVDSYASLLDYAMDNEPDWFHSLCDSSTYVVNAYIESLKREYR